ncbi:class I SAM-dependent methyltransferase [Streptomyces uncialis]|uniref:class I SAM-dependent methyltransferase n=1 Tax=Streptomyces uncialis TaxID=1048205 RepID=UPI0036510E0F
MTALPVTPAEYWDRYKPHRGEGEQPAPAVERFCWTPYPGHGPGTEVLGAPRTALELGPGDGVDLVYLARHHGVHGTGVDSSAVQAERARRWWREEPGVSFEHAEVCAFLSRCDMSYDAVYSVWGAVWFTDPEQLIPLVLERLSPGGMFAFSHAAPDGSVYGPQRMGGRWLEDRDDLVVTRWQYPPRAWVDMLQRHGFVNLDAQVVAAPEPDGRDTLLVRGERPV